MNKGFTIVCDNCGEKIKFASNDLTITLFAERDYDRNVIHLECDCGNQANSDEDY